MSRRFIYLAFALLALPGLAVAQSKPVAAPGSSVPQSSMAYGGTGKPATSVTLATPLPTAAGPMYPADVIALTGTSTGAQTVGPFVPILGRPITIALSAASWPGGSVQLLRSTDNGATKLPLTPAGVTIGVYSGVGADSPWIETESGAAYYLSLPGSGITYRVAQ